VFVLVAEVAVLLTWDEIQLGRLPWGVTDQVNMLSP
jgi:hypothetical protein